MRPSGTRRSTGCGPGCRLGALLRLLLRRRFHPLGAATRHWADARLTDVPRHPVARHSSLRHPVLDALALQADAVFMLRRQHRIVAAQLLDEAPVARAAAIGHHNVVIRALLGAGTG